MLLLLLFGCLFFHPSIFLLPFLDYTKNLAAGEVFGQAVKLAQNPFSMDFTPIFSLLGGRNIL